MTATLLDLRTDVRSHIDEATQRMWTDDELNRWLAEGARDIARRSKCILDTNTQGVVADTATYPAPGDCIQVYFVEFVQSASYRIGLEYMDYASMETAWYSSRDVSGSIPRWWTSWGFTGTNFGNQNFPGGVAGQTIRLYPRPSATLANALVLYYYRLPRPMVRDQDPLEIPAGFENLPVLYAEWVALRKAQEPTWRDAHEMYELQLNDLIAVTRRLSDQLESFHFSSQMTAGWWAGSDDYGY